MDPNSSIRLISLMPFMMVSISLFVSFLLLITSMQPKPRLPRKILWYASFMFFSLGCFFVARGLIFSFLEANETNYQTILDIDRFVRGLPFLFFVSVLVFTREYFVNRNYQTIAIFVSSIAFLVFIITVTTPLVLELPISNTGAFGIVRSTDSNDIWSWIYIVGAGTVIIFTIIEMLQHRNSTTGIYIGLAYGSIIFGVLWDLWPLVATRNTGEVIQVIPGLDIGAFIFTVIICHTLLQGEPPIEHKIL